MKKTILISIFFLIATPCYGSIVENVKVEKVKKVKDGYWVDFSARFNQKKTQFSVALVDSDPKYRTKLGLVKKKIKLKEKFKLNLRVMSFSNRPKGIRYNGSRVKFFTPNKKTKKSKK